MLFLGTERFPEENGFDEFLTTFGGGGFSNALTKAEDTCFYFSCRADALAASLERFGDFFQSPLFSADVTERELGAIDSEFLKNVLDDGFRFDQLLRSRANPLHPFSKFGGGTTSLCGAPTCEPP
ncbi:unnamed protein product [Prorocentrum cordatum]|uniref:Peptidase M16 N-terminal domain-containing protein n=1 Tax=Prorocentrum cordatum TaxID=2364126 RepID=A0ABN9V017_9DINO|nr:unnamed protein product [Polarella glacialis]